MSNWVTLLDRAARLDPHQPAIVADGATWSFADVARSSRSAGTGLAASGLGPGDRVLVVARNIPEYLILATAVARIGAVLVPVNFRLTVHEIAAVAADCGARAIAVDEDFRDAGGGVADLVPSVEILIGLEGQDSAPWRSFRTMMKSTVGAPAHNCADEDLARIMYTSGTTGPAKGVEISHGMWIFNTLSQVRVLDVRHGDRILVTAPMHHVGGFDLPGPGAWLAGATLVLQRRFVAEESVALMREQQVTGATLVQTMLHRLVHEDRADLAQLRLRWLQFGSLPTSVVATLRETMPGVVLIRGYGMTETLGGLCHNHITPDSTDLTSVGVSLPFMEVQVIDESGLTCPADVEGDILVRGPKVTRGYYGNTEATSAVLSDGWLATGDIGKLDESSRLTITDRRKDLIRSGSENISSQEIEEILYRHQDVSEAAVIGRPDHQWGEIPVAYVVSSRPVPADELSSHCRASLAGFKVPKEFVRVAELPRNASGKVSKQELRDGRVSPL